MRLFPAIDILGGSAVRLVKGDFGAMTVYDEDPLSAARTWVDAGARDLHVVDLDGARDGQPVNLAHLQRIAELGVPVQYGGGLRSGEAIATALAAGAARVILGTAAFKDPRLLEEALAAHGPERVMVSVDVRGGRGRGGRVDALCRRRRALRVRPADRARSARARLHERRPGRDARWG